MVTWDDFLVFASVSVFLWGAASVSAFLQRRGIWLSVLLTLLGTAVFGSFIAGLWISLDRPPMKTMGETRLWYSAFMMISGLLTYMRWRYRWILSFSTVVATVFCVINVLKPEIHDQSLMPALQSLWFIPHVTVYMFSYSVLCCAFLLAVAGLFSHKEEYLYVSDRLVYIGTAFLTVGMLTGAIWAKSAWGHYWNWDPKETWAAVTWTGYLIYIHLRLAVRTRPAVLYAVLVLSFLALQMCWYGVNYLPAARQSVHVYSRM